MIGGCQEDDGLEADNFTSGTLGNDSDDHTRLLTGQRVLAAPELTIILRFYMYKTQLGPSSTMYTHLCTRT